MRYPDFLAVDEEDRVLGPAGPRDPFGARSSRTCFGPSHPSVPRRWRRPGPFRPRHRPRGLPRGTLRAGLPPLRPHAAVSSWRRMCPEVTFPISRQTIARIPIVARSPLTALPLLSLLPPLLPLPLRHPCGSCHPGSCHPCCSCHPRAAPPPPTTPTTATLCPELVILDLHPRRRRVFSEYRALFAVHPA